MLGIVSFLLDFACIQSLVDSHITSGVPLDASLYMWEMAKSFMKSVGVHGSVTSVPPATYSLLSRKYIVELSLTIHPLPSSDPVSQLLANPTIPPTY